MNILYWLNMIFFGNCTFSGSSQIEKVDQCMPILLQCGENKDVVILYVNRFKLFSDYSMLKMDWNLKKKNVHFTMFAGKTLIFYLQFINTNLYSVMMNGTIHYLEFLVAIASPSTYPCQRVGQFLTKYFKTRYHLYLNFLYICF